MKVSPSGEREVSVTVKPRGPRLSGINISQHVNFALGFRSKSEKIIYESFQTHQSNKHVFLIFQVLETFIFLYGKLVTYRVYPTIFSAVSLLIAVLAPVVLGWILVFMHYNARQLSKGKYKRFFRDSYMPIWESLWFVGTAISFGLTIIAVGDNGTCSDRISNSLSRMCGCNYARSGELPDDKMIGSFFFPVMYTVILKGIKWEAVILGLSIDVFAVFFTLKHYNLTTSMGTYMFFLLFSLAMLYENRRQRISEFLVTQSQQDLLDEVERLAAETHAKELRSMIGNVAHDLKTPMTAYVSGLEDLTSVLADMTEHIERPKELSKNVAQAQESIQQMKDVNAFMLMSINRCIDYTKASNNIVLVPRLETVDFREMLQLPLNCMKNLQNHRIAVKLNPVSNVIADQIITDPQWFQENLLCLLSNAVKYSSEGTVTITTSLTSVMQVANDFNSFHAIHPKERLLRVDCTDTGIGISDEAKASLFSPFKQAQRLAGGTGLGLYSLARRLEALGGAYGVENRADGKPGSNFWFAIPYRCDDTIEEQKTPPPTLSEKNRSDSLVRETVDQVAKHPSEILPVGDNNSGKTKALSVKGPGIPHLNILLVDDSISIQKMSGKMLTRLGHKVTTAENGAVALKLMSSTFIRSEKGELLSKFDVVLMDLQMPIMDGLEATKRLRALENSTSSCSPTHKCTSRAQSPPTTKYLTVSDVEDAVSLFEAEGYEGNSGKHHQLIIGVSACSDDVTTGEAFAAGVDAFVPKPFTMQSFNDCYLSLMQRKKAREPL